MSPVLPLLVSTAIPVVMFSLWKEYFEQDWNSPENEERGSEEGLNLAIARIRLAGLLSTALQLVLFLATSEIRKENSLAAVAGLWITLAGLVAQRVLQSQLERRILGASSPESNGTKGAHGPGSARVLWAFVGVVVYLGLLGGSLVVTALAIALFKLSGIQAMVALGAGTLVGYTLSLLSNFVLSPWLMKRLLPGRTLESGDRRARMERWFLDASVDVPELQVLDSGETKGNSIITAWVSGIAGLRGPFRPVLWMTPALLSDLTDSEFEAVIKHEVVHLKKRHLLQRFALSWAMSLLVLVTLAGALGLTAWLPSAQAGPVLPAFSLFLSVALVWGSIKGLQEQSKSHELEADLFSVTLLGVKASSLISALKKAEAANQKAGRASLLETHPDLEARLESLAPLAALEKQVHTETSSSDDHRQAA